MATPNVSSEKEATDLVVIGAGPGGYAAAFRAADHGMDVTLIDPEEAPGGVCLYRGCIPSKAYLHVAKVIEEARSAGEWGVSFSEPQIDLEKLRARKNDVVGSLTGGLAALCRARGVKFVRGRASFIDGNTLHVECVEPRRYALVFKRAIIATGSRPASLPTPVRESSLIMSSTAALEVEDIPGALLVVGGGYIGLEIGSVYAALGSRVTVVEMSPALLPGADADLVKVLHAALTPRFEKVLLSTRVVDMAEKDGSVVATLAGEDGNERSVSFDRALIAIGRKPNSSGLGLRNTSVEVDEKGFIRIDANRRTKEPSVYAIGDVAGEPMLAHKATHEGTTVADALAGHDAVFEPNAIPAVVFTDPEVAWCGLTENGAAAEGIDVQVARFPWQASGRAVSLGAAGGFTKLVCEPETGRLLGVGMVGSGAGELIGEGVLALEMGAVAEDLAAAIHAHPTLSETVMEAADVFAGLSVHLKQKKRAARGAQG